MTDTPPPPATTSRLTKIDRPPLGNAGRLMTDHVQIRLQANAGGMMETAESDPPVSSPPFP